jgi:hypothetical protein
MGNIITYSFGYNTGVLAPTTNALLDSQIILTNTRFAIKQIIYDLSGILDPVGTPLLIGINNFCKSVVSVSNIDGSNLTNTVVGIGAQPTYNGAKLEIRLPNQYAYFGVIGNGGLAVRWDVTNIHTTLSLVGLCNLVFELEVLSN